MELGVLGELIFCLVELKFFPVTFRHLTGELQGTVCTGKYGITNRCYIAAAKRFHIILHVTGQIYDLAATAGDYHIFPDLILELGIVGRDHLF